MNVFELPEECERAEFKDIIAQNGGIMILKFGADWCGPCQKIKPYVQECLNDLEKHNRDSKSPKNLFFSEIIVDDYFDIYSLFKTKKMVQGIPHMLCYVGSKNDERTHYYIADYSVSGANQDEIKAFFDNIKSEI